MLKKSLVTISLLCISLSDCFASCELDQPVSTRPYPIALTLPISGPVIIRADAPANSVLRLQNGTYLESTHSTGVLALRNCEIGVDAFGNSSALIALNNESTANYKTNIDGLAIRAYNVLPWDQGEGENVGGFPGRPNRIVNAGSIVNNGVWMRIELYKTQDHLDLKNPDGDVVVNSTPRAFFRWYVTPSSYFWYLDLPEITIVSTPVCTVIAPSEINFNNVTKANLTNGVSRNIPFGLNCITDYGHYSAVASIQSTSATSDGDFIKVTDKAGNTDRMKIRISDSSGQVLKLDGSTSDKQTTSTSSGMTTNFAWKATLLPVSSSSIPELGDFTANAEIIIQVN